MCAPELDFCDYALPHFQTCPLLSHLRGGLGFFLRLILLDIITSSP